ncbi:hypothetical protein VM98_38080, partial [Streptomyces rubellomurinus subsp. indigoferus]
MPAPATAVRPRRVAVRVPRPGRAATDRLPVATLRVRPVPRVPVPPVPVATVRLRPLRRVPVLPVRLPPRVRV